MQRSIRLSRQPGGPAMTEIQMEFDLHHGESLTARIGQLIAGPNIVAREEQGRRQVLRHLKTLRDHSRPNQYVVRLSYETLEDDDLR